MPDDSTPGRDILLDCPAPIMEREHIELAHGSGGLLMHQLIAKVFAAGLADPALDTGSDAALVDLPAAGHGCRLAFTTDSYVVKPLFFPGGDIGALAVNGTVNDLAMRGARPLYLSAGFILEEGLPVATLERIVASMRAAAEHARVHIVTGDTKVVDRGSGDGVFINTAGLGVVAADVHIGPERVQPGDAVIVSGDLGRHGMAILSVRQGLSFDSQIVSDCAALADLVHALIDAAVPVHCLRDLTRGGLATAIVEIARAAGLDIELCEPDVPVAGNVRAACELLGLDPFYVANEGRMVVMVPEAHAGRALDILRRHPLGAGAARVGRVAERGGRVTLRTALGTRRVLDMLSGEQLPRIC
jgi:hydrogenase expression/formation protein HypE